MSAGGKRKGSGRKSREELGKKPRIPITVRLEPDVAVRFKSICETEGLSQAAKITNWVLGK